MCVFLRVTQYHADPPVWQRQQLGCTWVLVRLQPLRGRYLILSVRKRPGGCVGNRVGR